MMSPWSGLRSVRCGPQTRVCRCGCVICAHVRLPGLGADRAQVDMSVLSRSRWTGCPPRVDRCHLSSPDSSSHHAARNHVPAGAVGSVPGLLWMSRSLCSTRSTDLAGSPTGCTETPWRASLMRLVEVQT